MDGLLYHLRFGFPPNRLHYCGPRDTKAILDYIKAEKSDQGLRELLEKFRGATPYMEFIARENKVQDIFDRRVVEAYWIGNDLLKNCDLKSFYTDLYDRFRKMVSKHSLDVIIGSVPFGARPHHSFHVLHIFSQTGGMEKNFKPALAMINNCLIRPGEVISKIKNHKLELKIKSKKLEYQNGRVRLVPSAEIVKVFDASRYKKGDKVAIHWGHICDKLSARQSAQLNFYNNLSLNLFAVSPDLSNAPSK